MTRIYTTVLMVFLLIPSVQFAQKSREGQTSSPIGRIRNDKSLIGYVRKEHLADGCGCTYSIKGRAIYSDDFGGNVWMNIDGQDVRLKLASSLSTPRGEVRKGQRTSIKYVAPSITVRMDTVVGKDYGEGNDYSGTITVKKTNRQQTVKVVGSCGC